MLLIDAANVVGSRPDGWWRDRPGAARRLVEQLGAAVAASRLPEGVVVVLEGAARKGVGEGVVNGVDVVHAPGEGDDSLAAIAARAAGAGEPVRLVSADRALGDRVRATGATVLGPRWLLDRLVDGRQG